MKKKTDELMKILNEGKELNDYLKENEEEFADKTLTELLNIYLEKCGIKKPDVIRGAGIEGVYAYQIFDGKKLNPSRDKLLQLCFGMKLSLEDTQNILKRAGYQPLYPRIRRDSAIIFALIRKISLPETNDILDEIGERIFE